MQCTVRDLGVMMDLYLLRGKAYEIIDCLLSYKACSTHECKTVCQLKRMMR
jgi:hypothetical protein